MKGILLFNCNENLVKILSFLNIQTVSVSLDKQNCTISQLLDSNGAGISTLRCAAPFTDEMIVFADFEEADLDSALALLRSTGNGHILKAIVTPTNQNWPATLLYRELCSERKAMEQIR